VHCEGIGLTDLTEEKQNSIADLSSTILNRALLKRKTEKWFKDTVKYEAKQRYGARALVRLTYGEFEPDSPGDISWRVHNDTMFIHHSTQSYYKPLLSGVDYEKALELATEFIRCADCPLRDVKTRCSYKDELCVKGLVKYFKEKWKLKDNCGLKSI
jgi:hypothetical protein